MPVKQTTRTPFPLRLQICHNSRFSSPSFSKYRKIMTFQCFFHTLFLLTRKFHCHRIYAFSFARAFDRIKTDTQESYYPGKLSATQLIGYKGLPF